MTKVPDKAGVAQCEHVVKGATCTLAMLIIPHPKVTAGIETTSAVLGVPYDAYEFCTPCAVRAMQSLAWMGGSMKLAEEQPG